MTPQLSRSDMGKISKLIITLFSNGTCSSNSGVDANISVVTVQ